VPIERYSNPFERKKLVNLTEILISPDAANQNIRVGCGLIKADRLADLPFIRFMFHLKPD
jgi:hypothetical protein